MVDLTTAITADTNTAIIVSQHSIGMQSQHYMIETRRQVSMTDKAHVYSLACLLGLCEQCIQMMLCDCKCHEEKHT